MSISVDPLLVSFISLDILPLSEVSRGAHMKEPFAGEKKTYDRENENSYMCVGFYQQTRCATSYCFSRAQAVKWLGELDPKNKFKNANSSRGQERGHRKVSVF